MLRRRRVGRLFGCPFLFLFGTHFDVEFFFNFVCVRIELVCVFRLFFYWILYRRSKSFLGGKAEDAGFASHVDGHVTGVVKQLNRLDQIGPAVFMEQHRRFCK